MTATAGSEAGAAAGAAVAGVSKAQRAYRWIRERILAHDYTPGYRLVLATVAAELDMSVVPVREAVRRLEAEGLVTFERNVGARVAMLDDTAYRHAMETIAVVESAATALASRHLSASDLRRARALNDVMVGGLDRFDPRSFSALNQEFHHVLYAACPNPRMLAIVEAEWARLGRLRDSIFAFVPGRARDSVREHAEILALVEARAPVAEIEQAVRRHRAGTLAAFLGHRPHADHEPEER
ncbi:GntR family transcriptional regulator [Cellulosimicrobium sp. NPDC057862]|uniref:GntR family transcriptional regulator n=1 Tax=Cellulosimicrobium sp. NPDC057862 TaxID=3346266 RepID=UPI003670D57B